MKIYWTESAVGDLRGIKEYIARDSEYYARDLSNPKLKKWEIGSESSHRMTLD